MLLKFGAIILCFFAEIASGIYMYMHFESLFARFIFFVLTAILVAMIVIKLAGPVGYENLENTGSETSSDTFSEKENISLSEKEL